MWIRAFSWVLSGLIGGALVVTALGCRAKLEPSPAIEKSIAFVSERCHIVPEQDIVDCPHRESGEVEVEMLLVDKKPRLAALHTLVLTLGSDDPKKVTIAADMINDVYGRSFGPSLKEGSVATETADLLLQKLPRLPKLLALRIAASTVHAAILAGRREELERTLSALEDREVQRKAYRALMIHGRLASFPQIKALAQSPDHETMQAALGSVVAMPDWTEPERSAICPWASGLAQGPDPVVAQSAAAVLLHCPAAEYGAIVARLSATEPPRQH